MLPMQAMMMKKLLALGLVLFLSACVSSGSPWDRTAATKPAEQAPSQLTREAIQTLDTAAVYTPAAPAPEAVPAQAPVPPPVMAALPPVKVALLLPMSGENAALGQAMLQAGQLALFDMGYKAFELMPRDTKGTADGAAQAAQAALRDGAQLILGPLFAAEVRAVKPIVDRSGVNMLVFSTDWTLAGGNTFVMGFLPFGQVQRVADYAAAKGYRRIGVLAPENDYGNAVVASYSAAAYRTGLGTGNITRFPAAQQDLSEVVRRFTKHEERSQYIESRRAPLEERLKSNPADTAAKDALAALEKEAQARLPFDAVLLPVGGEKARAIASLLTYSDMGPRDVKRLGTGLWDDTALAADPAMQGAWFAAPSPDLRRDFERRYRELYGTRPQRLATLAYDATALAAVLARRGFQDRGAPAFDRASLTNPNGFAGIDGIFRLRPDGMAERGLAVLEYNNGEIRVIDPAPSTFQQIGY